MLLIDVLQMHYDGVFAAAQFHRRGFIVAGTTMFFCDTNP